ncbi:MAG: alpha/beta fold hydrolase [Pirellulaceae bacterium]|nr:alpha/beta fold hydrolase [Pirellulaceae bacterium]
MSYQIPFIFCLLVCVAATCFVQGQETSPPTAGDIIFENKTYTAEDGRLRNYEVGTLYVKENRSDPQSRLIGLGFARYRAKQATGAPVFFLPGGPGSSFLEGNPPTLAALVRDRCDVIFVDQRGYSRNGAFLENIPFEEIVLPADADLDDRVAFFAKYTEAVVDHYQATDVDLSGYNILECIEDVNELRAALGYAKITLRGQSFGSQWSFGIMRQYPETVERALLSGVEPLNNAYDMPSHVFAALQRIWKSIDKDPRFHAYLPEGGMQEAAEVVLQRLESEPIKLFVEGESKPIRILGPDDFPFTSPRQILELYHGQTSGWAAARFLGRPSKTLISPLIDSSLHATPERLETLWHDPAVRFTTRQNFARYMATATIWPSPDVGDEFRTPKKCDIPVVFVNGDWDIKTPIENMYEIADYFPNSHQVIVHQAGHGTITSRMQKQHPDFIAQLVEFLETGKMDLLPAEIQVEKFRRFTPPKFAIDPAKTK